jgi:hypothetical protein
MKILIVVIAALVLAAAQASRLGGSNSICDRYSRALKVSNTVLLFKVVNGTVAGLVAANAPTKKYFDGTKPAGSTNFLTNGVALAALKNSLVNFFWSPLGCTDRPGRTYSGGSMSAVHKSMGINEDEFTFFVTTLLGVLTKAGVTANDVATVKNVLESTRGAIVTASNSICDKYSRALKLTNTALVTFVVKQTITRLVADDAPTKQYFDGTKPEGSINFLDASNAALLQALTDSLVNFFWGPLGCTMDPPRSYTGGGMKEVHSAMGINGQEFTHFKNSLAGVLKDAGVVAADVNAVNGVIESLRSAIVTA